MTEPAVRALSPFRVDDPEICARVIDAIVFGTLVTSGDDGPEASHAPFLLDREDGRHGTLRAHLARANAHARVLEGRPALVTFQGPSHYVTPSWYASKEETGRVVPTWNYVVVHARGRTRLEHDPDRLRARVEALTDRMEATRAVPWRVADAPRDFVARMIEGIVGVDVEIEWLEGRFKLGQNRSPADRLGVVAGLRAEHPEVWADLVGIGIPD